ncbi:class I SAM-dependent methyltransferase [Sulfuricurvum sp.]|uniref:class I SAM-dependent methyltransferase n=1 Tax=Sulfuricurvum sp. TaxID=2025608 RepID=UPI0035677790
MLASSYPEEALNMYTTQGKKLYEFVCSELDKLSGSLIELGCGKGRFALHYADRHPTDKVYGIDLAENNLKIARLRAKLMNYSHVRFIQGDVTKPLPYRHFSNIICIETIEHLPDLGTFVQNIKTILNRGGTFILTTPHELRCTRDGGYIKPNHYLQSFGITDKYFHSGYTLPELKILFQSKDFEIVKSIVALSKSVLILKRL